jgi:hypothetical protein
MFWPTAPLTLIDVKLFLPDARYEYGSSIAIMQGIKLFGLVRFHRNVRKLNMTGRRASFLTFTYGTSVMIASCY